MIFFGGVNIHFVIISYIYIYIVSDDLGGRRLFNAKSCFYIYIKYMICLLFLQTHTVK